MKLIMVISLRRLCFSTDLHSKDNIELLNITRTEAVLFYDAEGGLGRRKGGLKCKPFYILLDIPNYWRFNGSGESKT